MRLSSSALICTAIAVTALAAGFGRGSSIGSFSDAGRANAAEPTPMVSAAVLIGRPTPVPAARGTLVQVVGDVTKAQVLGLKELEQMRRSSVTLEFMEPDGKKRLHTFTGVLLRDLLAAARPTLAGGTDTAVAAYAVVHGVDGSSAIIGFPEFEPAFNGKQILVAYLMDGTPLPGRGIAQLVVPEDATQGRFISGITRIEVGSPPP